MNDLPRQKLLELVAQYGHSLCDDPRRCGALLKDHCGQYKREIFVLVNALEKQVAKELINASANIPQSITLARLTRRLEDELGLTQAAAKWAVETWAIALGIIIQPIEIECPIINQNSIVYADKTDEIDPIDSITNSKKKSKLTLLLLIIFIFFGVFYFYPNAFYTHIESESPIYIFCLSLINTYMFFVRSIGDFLFGWINFTWISISSEEYHVLVFASIFSFAAFRAEYAYEKKHKLRGSAIATATFVFFIDFAFAFIPSILLPGYWGVVSAVLGTIFIMIIFFINPDSADSKFASGTEYKREFISVLKFFLVLMSINYLYQTLLK